ncbi:MAG: pyridoxal 5'-phosphate synthase glutaminase subunit PdxT [Methanocorpusculum sp.]|jgi:5'-phosphate synthase pdxT subunit|nr:pyridoxal 5'-phosphate synthase glutaminase subunit PdxT [Methanocorpusculum sp.]MDD4132621.1 pyridoxal 5'-phosphate synthase glutaminase subunit PdxT [Methanocorpusculum sp.]
MRIGVLALQGAFIEHIRMLNNLGAEAFEIRNSLDLLEKPDGLVFPGGESTVMSKLLSDLGLFEKLRSLIISGTPVMGTCAGLILLAKNVEGGVPSIATMDITAVRNAYGRQLGSFETVAPFADAGNIPMTFIRAPVISNLGKNVRVLAEVDGKIVAVREENQLALSFHPELGQDTTVHTYFLNMVSGII